MSMEIKCIKGVDEETWREFKALAAKNNMKMSSLLKIVIKEFKKNKYTFWDEMLNGKRLLSDKEAGGLAESASNLRKERGFRA